jgi:hypothetical protein
MFLLDTGGRKLQIKMIYTAWFWLESRNEDARIVGDILLKAASEPDFRRLLLTEPSKVLDVYDISPEAKSIIKSVIADFK